MGKSLKMAEKSMDVEAFGGLFKARKPFGSFWEVVVVSYSRKALGQTGDGHYSPVGGYHKDTDQVLTLDVARPERDYI